MNALPIHLRTAEELLAMPDDGVRHELIEGVLSVDAAPNWDHQGVRDRLN